MRNFVTRRKGDYLCYLKRQVHNLTNLYPETMREKLMV